MIFRKIRAIASLVGMVALVTLPNLFIGIPEYAQQSHRRQAHVRAYKANGIPPYYTKINMSSFAGKERVSAIISACSRVKPLQDAIASILVQTQPVFEIVVALDSGDLCLRDIPTSFGYSGIVRVLKVPKCPDKTCGKAGRSRQYAMEHAHPNVTHFAFLDDDDVWLPRKMEVQLATMKKDNVGIISSDAFLDTKSRCVDGSYVSWNLSAPPPTLYAMNLNEFSADGRMLRDKFHGHIPEKNISLNDLLIHNIFVTSSVVVSKAGLAGEAFDTTAPNGMEDYGLWKRILNRTNGTLIHEQLVIYDNFHGEEC